MAMSMIRRSQPVSVGIVAVLALTLITPLAVTAQEQDPALAPVAGPSWDETSGYGAVEASRAAASALFAPIAAPSWDETSGYGAVEASRATIGNPVAGTTVEQTRIVAAQHALQGGDLGSLQEDALLALVAAAPSWDDTSGYGSVEASRAANALPVAPAAITTQVPSDVRWAPAGTIQPESSLEARRVNAAQRALQSTELGSLQEDALAAVVADAMASDETRDYGSLEATRAELLAQFRAIELSLSSSLGEE